LWSGIIGAGLMLVIAVLPVFFRLNPSGTDDGPTKAQPQTSTHHSSLEIISVHTTSDFELDVTLRNVGDEPAVIHTIAITVVQDRGCYAPIIKPSAKYDLPIGDLRVGQSRSIAVSHYVKPHDVDRFKIALHDIRALSLQLWLLFNKHEIVEADVDVNPNPTIFYNRGYAWTLKKDYDKAIKDHDEAIRLDPKYTSAFINRGNVWSQKKDYDKAIKDYDEAIRLDPKNAFSFNTRSAAWYAKKEYDKAIEDLDEAIRLNPKNVDAFYYKARCYALQNNSDRAIDNLEKAVAVGFRDFKQMIEDTDLDSIRNDPRYKKLIEHNDK